METMSAITVCTDIPSPLTAAAPAPDTPLTFGAVSASERFRFVAEGDTGAGGSVGGVRVPLAAAMLMGLMRKRCR